MTPDLFLRIAIDPVLSLLPERMRSDAARAMVLSICLQESALRHRRQISGPARGFPQFEIAGVIGVMRHSSSGEHLQALLDALAYDPHRRTATHLHAAIEHSDVLAAGMARLLLWTVPRPLPLRSDPEGGWRYYVEGWRPGRPHPETWAGHYATAWAAVDPLPTGATT